MNELDLSARLLLLGLAVGVPLLLLGLYVLYLGGLHYALAAVPPKVRGFAPALVWLNLIPGFNLLWIVVTAAAVAGAFRRAYAIRRRTPPDRTFGLVTGLFTAFIFTLTAAGWLLAPAVASAPLGDLYAPLRHLDDEGRMLLALGIRVGLTLLWVTSLFRHRKSVNRLQKALFGNGPGARPRPRRDEPVDEDDGRGPPAEQGQGQ